MTTHDFRCKVSTARVANLVGVTRQSFHNWRQEHIVEPLRRAGLQPPESITLQACWAISIARALKNDGLDIETCQRVSEFLDGLEPSAISKAFSEGRVHLFVICDQVAPFLLPLGAIETEYVGSALREALRQGKQLSMRAINVQPLLLQLSEIAKADAKESSHTKQRIATHALV